MKHSRGRDLALIVLWLAGCAPRPDVPVPCTRHINRIEAFSVCIPPGWVLQDTTYSFMGRIGVFTLARNQAAAGVSPYISMQDWSSSHRTGWQEAAAALVEQVPAGGVVVMFWHFQGGPAPICRFHKDTVGDTLAALVDSLRFDQPGRFGFSFAKWSDDWQIEILARDRTSAVDMEIRSLLRSIVFEPVPVVSKEQAAQLAYRALQTDGTAAAEMTGVEDFDVSITEADSTFDVCFRPCQPCEDRTNGHVSDGAAWSCRVYTDGRVEVANSR